MMAPFKRAWAQLTKAALEPCPSAENCVERQNKPFPEKPEEPSELKTVSVAMPADSRREKIFDFVREFAVKDFRIVPVRDSTQQNKA